MKALIKPDFLIQTIANETVLIGSGEQINFSRMLVLNDTAIHIVEQLQQHFSPVSSETLAQSLVESYQVDFSEAVADVEELLRLLAEQGVVVIE
ncbi:MAG: PqqD family protein [Bacteroidaceae bacterium]|nr:PqqD family protein [Bacteroidaceae bacterium]